MGYNRREAAISYAEFKEKCGVSKKKAAACCLQMQVLGWIKIQPGDKVNENKYEICLED